MAQTKDRPVEKPTPTGPSPFRTYSPAEEAAIYAEHMRRNVEIRDRLIAEFGSRTPEELAAAGVATEGAVFSVRYHDAEVFPGYQFDEQGRPLPVIAQVLAVLREVRSPWEIALWFTGANGWLGAARPVDLLRTAPEGVVEAARHEAEELVF